jgi:hypothetical protein
MGAATYTATRAIATGATAIVLHGSARGDHATCGVKAGRLPIFIFAFNEARGSAASLMATFIGTIAFIGAAALGLLASALGAFF